MPIKVIRIFNTYGPRMNMQDGRVVSNFIVQALRGEDITIHGEGQQTRSFCYVDDLIEGIMRMMATGPDVTGPVNLGNPAEMTITQLATEIIELTGSRSKVVSLPPLQDDPQQRRPDIALAGDLLDWRPQVERRAGLEATIAYFERVLAGEDAASGSLD